MRRILFGVLAGAALVLAQVPARAADLESESRRLADAFAQTDDPCTVERVAGKALVEDPQFGSLPKATQAVLLTIAIGCSYYSQVPDDLALARRLEAVAQKPLEVGIANLMQVEAGLGEGKLDADRAVKVLTVWPDGMADYSLDRLYVVLRLAKMQDGKTHRRVLDAVMDAPWTEPSVKQAVANGVALDYATLLADDKNMDGVRKAIIRMDDPDALFQIAQDRRFEPLWPELDNRGRFNWKLFGEVTLNDARNGLAKAPNDVALAGNLLDALSREGRYDEAVDLGETWRGRIKAEKVIAANEQAHWLLDAYGSALVRLNRMDEARAIYAEAAVVGDDQVSHQMNWAGKLLLAGRFEEAIAAYAKVPLDGVSPYGRAWVEADQACAMAEQHRAEADALAARLKAHWKDSPAAYAEALVCLNQTQAAADLFIQRLADPAMRQDALMAVRTGAAPANSSAFERELDRRKQAILAQPRVAAAINKAGRRLEAPVGLTSWGSY